MTNIETSHPDGTLARAKAESASRDEEPAVLRQELAATRAEAEEPRAGLRSAAEKYREAPRPGLTRAQRFTLLAVALVPIGFVLVGLSASVDPDSPLVWLVLAGPFLLLSAPLFLGILALMAAKPQGSPFRGGRVAGLVALTVAFLLSLPFAALLDFGILVELACRGGEGCL
jgi:hypothetical protein